MDPVSEFLTRGVANIIPGRENLEKVLRSERKLNIYLGIDPTAVHIHLGNAVPLRKLKQLVDLGHHVTFLIGDFTALIGDTSDKDSERPVLTYEQIEANFQTYREQASKILDFSKVSVRHNSEWLKALTFDEIVKLARHFSLNDFISRELIKKRLGDGKSVSLPEVLYPVMQGYDSYFMDTDLQIGGTDQTFNMQAGRTLQKDLRRKDTFVMSTVFLEGTDGRKMSKTWDNAIWLTDKPEEMFGKVMSLKDDLIDRYFLLATNLPQSKIPQDGHPMDRKKQLALQIVSELHDAQAAASAQNYFEKTIQERNAVATGQIQLSPNTTVIEALVTAGFASSNSDARRLIDQGGVKFNDQKVSDYKLEVHEGILSVGSRKFVKIQS